METLIIYIEKITFADSSSGYTVMMCSTDDATPLDIPPSSFPRRCKNPLVCIYEDVSGFIDNYKKGCKYSVCGEWKQSKYGKQFIVKTITPFIAPTHNEIVEYLTTLQGIGKTTAEAIYKTFEDKSVDIINNAPEKLLIVKGISKTKLTKIVDSLECSNRFKKIVDFFSNFSLSPRKIKKIYEVYEEESTQIVSENPFLLCAIEGITFQDANQIAIDSGVGLQSMQRITAAIKYVLQTYSATTGDLYELSEDVINATLKTLNKGVEEKVTEQQVEDGFCSLINNGSLKCITSKGGTKYVYSIGSYICESEVAKKLIDMTHNPNVLTIPENVIINDIDELEKKYKIKLADKQKIAIIATINNPVSIITGGPGTGKTTVLRFILDVFRKHFDNDITLCAPTGRAARRMAESTGFLGAETIHSTLGIQNDYSWAQTAGSIPSLDTSLIVVDESSMIDMELLYVFLQSVDYKTKVVFIGDSEQLPSVGAGNCLREMIKSKLITTTKLDVIYRQKGESKVVINSNKLQKQEFNFEFDETFSFDEISDLEKVKDKIVSLYLQELKKPDKSLDNIQILTPFKAERIPCSTSVFNKIIQEKVNPLSSNTLSIRVGKYLFRRGDKVIQQKNSNLAKNGDIGYIKSVAYNDKEIVCQIEFIDGEKVSYNRADMEENMIALAYAITVHKSQGSEFSTVIMPIINRHEFMLNKNLIYTAWTRAKENVFLVGSKSVLEKSGRVCNIDLRKTILSFRMKQRQVAYEKKIKKKSHKVFKN